MKDLPLGPYSGFSSPLGFSTSIRITLSFFSMGFKVSFSAFFFSASFTAETAATISFSVVSFIRGTKRWSHNAKTKRWSHKFCPICDRFEILPSYYFVGWNAVSSVVDTEFGRFRESVVVTNKGLKMELVGLVLSMYKTIDVSRNSFEGEIPESIGLLKGLIVLNMSYNAFTGRFPQSLANLTNLQSLDLSQNGLTGEIPPQLGKLTFLERMNFSYNKLEGPIPQVTQIQSQNSSSFAENPGLCGAPLENACGGGEEEEEATEQEQDEEEKDQALSWTAAAIGYVPGVVCGFIIAHILTS